MSEDASALGQAMAVLEFDAIRETVASYARSEEAQAVLRQALPLFDRPSFEALRQRVDRFTNMFRSAQDFPSPGLPPVRGLTLVLRKEGTCLDEEGLFALGSWAKASVEFRAFFRSMDERWGTAAEAEAIPDAGSARDIVFSILEPTGKMRDLPAFKEIRRSIGRLRGEIDALVARYAQDEHTRSMLQSEVPTLRDGRTVLAVKANFKGRIRGIVHEASATGQTVYLEPEDVLERNNDLVREEARLRAEMAKVLRETTDRLRPHAEVLEAAIAAIQDLDAVLSRARYTAANRFILLHEPESGFSLFQARHPLLGAAAVPIDIAVDSGTRILIISGPNTGGKTVTLKTVGLFTLMNQFGLGVPAREGSSLPFRDAVFADIGDEQSISQSLSTFSAHMKTVSRIVREAGPHSLVLLDELGSGTDPEEGSAIGMALLDRLLSAGPLTLVTSHHSILKNFGYSREGCQNASVDFDGDTLSPTYRIVMGIPGESHALDIALRNGLARDVVDKARSYLAEERADVSALIAGLKSKHRRAEELEVERTARLKEAMEEQRKADLKELRLRQKELELKRDGAAELRRLLAESRKGLENLVRELKEGELTREKTLKVKEFISDLEAAAQAQDRELDALEEEWRVSSLPAERANAAPLAVGAEVLVGTARRKGRIIRAAKKGQWVVETGSVKMTVGEADLVVIAPRESNAVPTADISLHIEGSGAALLELDLRGMRMEEALIALQRQVDAAALSNLRHFGVIHGTGEGILMKAVQEWLKHCPLVADFRFARPEEGGFGKTEVSLR